MKLEENVKKDNETIAYLFGLLCGRGHIYKENKKIIIEFAHKNPTISGIAHCQNCGWLATEKKVDNPNKDLFCKNCNSIVPKSVKRVYEQRYSTINSINELIIPFLTIGLENCYFDIIGNEHMTFLIIDFKESVDLFDYIHESFEYKSGFDSFSIPKLIYHLSDNSKIEFVNGLLDTAGFFNSGGWLNRSGKNGEGWMRGYFQIVRNWKMPVLICNFLKTEFALPIHTIDWGHPNTRDSNMEDFYESNPLSWSREHQIKFFPEFYTKFKLRLKHKQSMFNELFEHNISVEFDSLDECSPPKAVSLNKVKPTHLGENDKRLPEEIRKHHDSFCQICSNLGCTFMNEKLSQSSNPELMYLTGSENNDESFEEVLSKYITKSNTLAEEIHEKKAAKLEQKINRINKISRTNPEQQLYEPLSKFYQIYLSEKYSTDSKVHDTSAYYLDKFIIQNDLHEEFDFCNEYRIKPDIVGFLKGYNQLAFMEVKANELVLQDLGQLLGYCLVANPIEAILVAPRQPSLSLIKILKTNSNLLEYSPGKKIEIATWMNGKLDFLNY